MQKKHNKTIARIRYTRTGGETYSIVAAETTGGGDDRRLRREGRAAETRGRRQK